MGHEIELLGRPGMRGSVTTGTLPVVKYVRDHERYRVAVSISVGPKGRKRGGLSLDVRRDRASDAKRAAVRDLQAIRALLAEAVAELDAGAGEGADG